MKCAGLRSRKRHDGRETRSGKMIVPREWQPQRLSAGIDYGYRGVVLQPDDAADAGQFQPEAPCKPGDGVAAGAAGGKGKLVVVAAGEQRGPRGRPVEMP